MLVIRAERQSGVAVNRWMGPFLGGRGTLGACTGEGPGVNTEGQGGARQGKWYSSQLREAVKGSKAGGLQPSGCYPVRPGAEARKAFNCSRAENWGGTGCRYASGKQALPGWSVQKQGTMKWGGGSVRALGARCSGRSGGAAGRRRRQRRQETRAQRGQGRDCSAAEAGTPLGPCRPRAERPACVAAEQTSMAPPLWPPAPLSVWGAPVAASPSAGRSAGEGRAPQTCGREG